MDYDFLSSNHAPRAFINADKAPAKSYGDILQNTACFERMLVQRPINVCKPAPDWISVLLQIAFYGMWFSQTDTCAAYTTEWLGLLPLQVVTCGAMV